MRASRAFQVFWWALGACLPAAGVAAQALPRVVIQTGLGTIEVEIDTIRAPITSANFLRYVDLGFYRFGRFHRTVREDNQPDSKVKIAVIQAGLDSLRVKDFPPIKLERTKLTGLRHKDGTLSIIHQEDANTYVPLKSIQTSVSARTMGINTTTGRLYLASADVQKGAAPDKRGRRPIAPGSLKLLFLDPVR